MEDKKITMEDVSKMLEALQVIRKFKIKAGEENFGFTNAEDLFQEILFYINSVHFCPHCGRNMVFVIKH